MSCYQAECVDYKAGMKNDWVQKACIHKDWEIQNAPCCCCWTDDELLSDDMSSFWFIWEIDGVYWFCALTPPIRLPIGSHFGNQIVCNGRALNTSMQSLKMRILIQYCVTHRGNWLPKWRKRVLLRWWYKVNRANSRWSKLEDSFEAATICWFFLFFSVSFNLYITLKHSFGWRFVTASIQEYLTWRLCCF